jgi:hypothetical protein
MNGEKDIVFSKRVLNPFCFLGIQSFCADDELVVIGWYPRLPNPFVDVFLEIPRFQVVVGIQDAYFIVHCLLKSFFRFFENQNYIYIIFLFSDPRV